MKDYNKFLEKYTNIDISDVEFFSVDNIEEVLKMVFKIYNLINSFISYIYIYNMPAPLNPKSVIVFASTVSPIFITFTLF